jgi:hypothetical protein
MSTGSRKTYISRPGVMVAISIVSTGSRKTYISRPDPKCLFIYYRKTIYPDYIHC